MGPTDPATKAWTDQGRVPTLIATAIVALPFVAPETGLYAVTAAGDAVTATWVTSASAIERAITATVTAGYGAYQFALANPQYIVGAQQFGQALVPGMGGATASWYGLAGWATRTTVSEGQKHR
jgi:hypothetical protein